jgi:hypothetical protein
VIRPACGDAPNSGMMKAMLRSRASLLCVVSSAVLFLLLATVLLPAVVARPQHEAEFRRLAEQIVAQRDQRGEGNASLFEYSLTLLDRMVFNTLDLGPKPDLQIIQVQFKVMVGDQPAYGQDYRVVPLGGTPVTYALVANFGVGGPSAVRLYRRAPRWRVVARIDRFHQKDFFDDYLEVVPVEAQETVFVTVTGRTDALHSGSFMGWRLIGEEVKNIWSTDLLPLSTYEATPKGVRISYCSDYPEDNPRACRRMTRERFAWDGREWNRVEQQQLPPSSSPAPN